MGEFSKEKSLDPGSDLGGNQHPGRPSTALHGNGSHFMPLDNCIEAMRQTGEEMSVKF